MATVVMVTIDSADPLALARWWADVLGGEAHADSHPGFYAVTGGRMAGVALGFQYVEAPTPGKNRVHLDVEVHDVAAEVTRLGAAGAAVVAEHRHAEHGFRWVVLADPDGNQFCLVPA